MLNICELLTVQEDVSRALAEDLADVVDYTATLVSEDIVSQAYVRTNQNMTLCGVMWVKETIAQFDPSIELTLYYQDGDKIGAGTTILEMKGNARSLLTIERTVLNFIQFLSGIATTTAMYVEMANNPQLQVMDTRKTIPGLRYAQKYAVLVGGGHNQRIGLFDGVLIKENHIIANHGIRQTLEVANYIIPEDIPIQVEVENLEELKEALQCGSNLILLDNMSIEMIEQAVMINQQLGKQALLEVSGNVDLASIAKYASTGVDRISIGGLTKHVNAVDLSMRFYN